MYGEIEVEPVVREVAAVSRAAQNLFDVHHPVISNLPGRIVGEQGIGVIARREHGHFVTPHLVHGSEIRSQNREVVVVPRGLEAEHGDLGVRRVVPDVVEGCSALVITGKRSSWDNCCGTLRSTQV